MYDLPIFQVLAWDCLKVPTGILCSGKHVHTCGFPARAYHVHVPALAAQALVNRARCLIRGTVPVFAPDAGITPEGKRLVESSVERGLFKEMDGAVHPNDKVT